MPYCPHCGEQVQQDDRFCIECGTELDRVGEDSSYGWQSEPPSDAVLDPESGETAAVTRGRTWPPLVVAILGVVVGAVIVTSPEMVLDSLESFGIQSGMSVTVVLATGALGLLSSLALGGLVVYYWYVRGHLDRLYFWGLVGIGLFGFFFGSNSLFLIPVGIGAYGLYSVL